MWRYAMHNINGKTFCIWKHWITFTRKDFNFSTSLNYNYWYSHESRMKRKLRLKTWIACALNKLGSNIEISFLSYHKLICAFFSLYCHYHYCFRCVRIAQIIPKNTKYNEHVWNAHPFNFLKCMNEHTTTMRHKVVLFLKWKIKGSIHFEWNSNDKQIDNHIVNE